MIIRVSMPPRAVASSIVGTIQWTRNSAIADKPCDAFRGHSRSPTMVPFDSY